MKIHRLPALCLAALLALQGCGSPEQTKGETDMDFNAPKNSSPLSSSVSEETAGGFFQPGEGASLGTWMWDATDLLRAQEALDFLADHHVTEVYVSLMRSISKEKYRAFLSAAAEKGIRVALIGADAAWATEEGGKSFDAFLEWFTEYQQSCQTDAQRFYGLHMDVEPHQLPLWQTEPEAARAGYMEFVRKSQSFCRAEGVHLELDIPFWFDGFTVEDEGEKMSLAEFCIRRADTVLLMSYRDNAPAVFECGWPEFTLAEKYGKKLILAVETGKIYEEINITFHHLGANALYEELRRLRSIVEEAEGLGEVGYAIHYYDSWRKLPPDGHPKGEDYPYAD